MIRTQNMQDQLFKSELLALSTNTQVPIGASGSVVRVPYDCIVNAKIVWTTALTTAAQTLAMYDDTLNVQVTEAKVIAVADAAVGMVSDLINNGVVVPAGSLLSLDVVSSAPGAGAGICYYTLRRTGRPDAAL